MCTKTKFTVKNWSDPCNFYSKVFFYYMLKKMFLLFFAKSKLLMFHNNIVKISGKKLNKWNLLKVCRRYLPYSFLHNLHSFLLLEKVKILDSFKKTVTRIKLFCA